eukprot:6771160-Prorocentrum_lima.AAC.1
MVKYIQDLEPISDRLFRLTFRGVLPVSVYSIYGPTSTREDAEKDVFYDQLQSSFQRWSARGPTYAFGDYNARIQRRLDGEEQILGPV